MSTFHAMNNRLLSRERLLASLISSCALLAACGGGTDSTETDTTSAEASTDGTAQAQKFIPVDWHRRNNPPAPAAMPAAG